MADKIVLRISECENGLFVVNDYNNEGQGGLMTRKELADYINPQTTAPAAPPYPSNQAQASAMNINALHAQTSNMLNANINDYLAGAQLNHQQWSSQGVNAHQVKLQRAVDNALAEQERIQKEHDAEHNPKKSSGERLHAFFSQAAAQGYQGRVLDYISAVKAAQCFLNSQGADNLQDDGK